MKTWTDGTCDSCNQPAYAHGEGYGGDVFHSCAYCGWFSEDEDSYTLKVNPDPDQALLIRMMDVINHLRGQSNLHEVRKGLCDMIEMMRVGRAEEFRYVPEGKWYGDENWMAVTVRSFATVTEAKAFLHEWEQECYRDGDTFPQKTRIAEYPVEHFTQDSLLKETSTTQSNQEEE